MQPDEVINKHVQQIIECFYTQTVLLEGLFEDDLRDDEGFEEDTIKEIFKRVRERMKTSSYTYNLAEMLRLTLTAEFGNWTSDTVVRCGSAQTYWHDASILLERYYKERQTSLAETTNAR